MSKTLGYGTLDMGIGIYTVFQLILETLDSRNLLLKLD